MSDNAQQRLPHYPDELNRIYAELNQHDVEQFYIGYQLWHTRQRLAALQEQIGSLRQQIVENAEQLQQVQPPAVAFATLARLQANGVNDIDLIDRMLERGEDWLDLTMQRLDYCEQLDFIHDNYAQWCEYALEGAYDWIDSIRNAYDDTMPRPAVRSDVDAASVDGTEELLLQKLTDEEKEEETLSLADTSKQPAVSLSSPAPTIEEAPEAGQPQGSSLQEPEMPGLVETVPETNLSLVSAGQESEHEYVESVHAADALTDLSPAPAEQAKYLEFAPPFEATLPDEADAETDPFLASMKQHSEPEYVELAPTTEASLPIEANAEGDLPQVTYAVPPELETQLPVEADAEADPSPAPVEETPLQEHMDLISTPEAPLPIEADIAADSPSVPADQATSQEHRLFEVGATHNQTDDQVSIPEYRKLSAPAQAVKPQRQRSFWLRLLAIFWP